MEVNFLNQKPCIPSCPAFSSLIFLVSFWVNQCVFPLSDSLQALLILLSYCLSIRLFPYFWSPNFCAQSFGFSCIRFLVYFYVISYLLVELFFFVVLECPVLSGFVTLWRYLFNIPSFACTFWFISSSPIVIFLMLPFPFCLSMFHCIF